MTNWEHFALILGALLAVLVGAADLFVFHSHLTAGVDDGLIVAGFGALGVKATGVLPS